MQLKRHIHTTLTALALLTLGACSDNVESDLYADSSNQITLSAINVSSVTSTRAEVKAFYEYNGIPITGCGVYLTVAGTENTTRYEGEVSGNGQFTVILTNLAPDTEYQARPYVQYTANHTARESKGDVVTFHTLVKPTFGDINPPVVQ